MNKLAKLFIRSILIVVASTVSLAAHSDIVVVVHKDNPTTSMTQSQVVDLFMGKYVAFPDGKKAVPIDIRKPESLKKNFYELLVGLPLARVNSYWSRVKFSGRARPPLEKLDSEETMIFLKNVPSAIAYIPRDYVTSDTKVVFSFNE